MAQVLASSPKPRSKMTNSRREALAALAFLTPNVLAFLLLTLGPAIFSIVMGFTNWTGISRPRWIGLDNYIKLVQDDIFLISLRNTLVYTLEFTPIVMAIALGMALLFNRKAAGTSLVRLLCFLPIVTDFVSVAFVWSWIYHFRFGILNYFLGLIGIPAQAWLGDAKWAMLAIVMLSIWRWMGYYAVIILAGLQGVPRELFEAATIDGANRWQLFIRITVPLISATLFFVLVTAIMSSLAVFEQMYILTEGGPQDSTISIAMFLYQQGFQFFKMGYASAVAWILFFLTFVVTAINWVFRKRWVYEG
ncbi:sugar ABC transporter permease [Chloroflexi bacterium TSY]|nr:sugar ABC transporter permease [Chloroflexi bacterium TSY]